MLSTILVAKHFKVFTIALLEELIIAHNIKHPCYINCLFYLFFDTLKITYICILIHNFCLWNHLVNVFVKHFFLPNKNMYFYWWRIGFRRRSCKVLWINDTLEGSKTFSERWSSMWTVLYAKHQSVVKNQNKNSCRTNEYK